jgi:AcrR family transcriptional regulator
MATAEPKLTRHQEAAAASRTETRRRLLHAAEAEFTERGYAAATVAKIAARAGVTVQTLYLAWGSKRALLRAYMEAALAGNDETSYPQARPDMIAAVLGEALDDPQAIVRQISLLYRQIAERAALGWQLYRDGAATDPEIATDWQALQALRHQTFSTLINRLPARSLRPGLTRAAATDTAWAIASPDTYDMLVRTRGYTLDQYQKWITTSLTNLLLRADPEQPSSRRPSTRTGTQPSVKSDEGQGGPKR